MYENSAQKLGLKLLVVITDRNKSKRLMEIYKEEQVGFYFMFNAVGSAHSDILDMLGLTGSEKVVALCLEPEVKLLPLMQSVAQRLEFKKPGKGIAFSVPLSGASSPIQNFFGAEMIQMQERRTKEMEKETQKEEIKAAGEPIYDLIVAVINEGFSGDLMDAAKAAGAGGGTIIHGRRIGEGEIVKFFGIPIQEEKEIVAILARREEKREIMQAIVDACGVRTEAKGILFSMHADSVTGLPVLPADGEKE